MSKVGWPTGQRARRLALTCGVSLTVVAVGLVIYWCWSNVLSVIQTYIIMHRLKVANPIDSFIQKVTGKAPAPT